MKTKITIVRYFRRFLLAALVAGFLIPAPAAMAVTSTQSIAIPGYDYPTLPGLWPSIEAAGGSTVPFVVVNPASGPGTTPIGDYTTRVNNNTNAGIRSIGYVDANYQARPITDVINDIDGWSSVYPGTSGIFFDRLKVGTASDLCYASYIYNYTKVKHPNSLVVHNFGTYADPSFEPYGDIFLTAEMDLALYQTWNMPTDGFHNNASNSNRFWHLIHTTDTSDFSTALTMARNNNAGWVYITDDTMPNPYDAIATYFNSEIAQIETLPASTIPNRGITNLPAGCLDTTLNQANDQHPGTNTATLAINNTSTTLESPAPHELNITLPSGVTLNSANGNDWSCTGTTCTYGSLPANSSSDSLALSFTADCSYASDPISITFTSFPAKETTSTIPLSAPENCNSPTPTPSPTDNNGKDSSTGDEQLAETGINAPIIIFGAAIFLAIGGTLLTVQRRQRQGR